MAIYVYNKYQNYCDIKPTHFFFAFLRRWMNKTSKHAYPTLLKSRVNKWAAVHWVRELVWLKQATLRQTRLFMTNTWIVKSRGRSHFRLENWKTWQGFKKSWNHMWITDLHQIESINLLLAPPQHHNTAGRV